jgi:hypothetical protein
MTSNATLKLIAPVPPISLPEMLKIFNAKETRRGTSIPWREKIHQ